MAPRNQHHVVWTEGMFLTPQHFQTQDQLAQDALQFRFGAWHFYKRSVVEPEVDREAVPKSLVRLTRSRGLLPDGEPFQMPGADCLPASHALAGYSPETQRFLDVFLALPERRLAGSNVTPAETSNGEAKTRVLDRNTPELPEYDHEDLGRWFGEFEGRIRDLMDTVIQTNYVPIPLSLTDRLVGSGTVQDDRDFKNARFDVAVSAKMGIDDIVRKVPHLVKVASNGKIQRIVQKVLAGIPLRHIPTPSSRRQKSSNPSWKSLWSWSRQGFGVQIDRRAEGLAGQRRTLGPVSF